MFKTPDITTAQIVAVVGAVIGLAVAGGLDISTALQTSILQLVAIVSGLLIAGDAVVRNGRARGNAKKDQ